MLEIRTSGRIILMKSVNGGGIMNIISAYAPQIGCTENKKEAFREELWEVMRGVAGEEMVVLGADMNGRVGEETDGYENEHGGNGNME